MRQVAIVRALRVRDEDVRVKTDELTVKEGEIQQFQQQLEQAQVYAEPQVYCKPKCQMLHFSVYSCVS